MASEQPVTSEFRDRFPLVIISVVRPEGAGGQSMDSLLGRGVQFVSGVIVMEWFQEAFEPEDQLEFPHQSIYGSVGDLENATGGRVIVEGEV